TLYPYILPLCIWRAWEYAAYRRYDLEEPVLDIGCGDGRFFRLLWPNVRSAVGVDHDPLMVEAAKRSGVYREVFLGPAHRLPFSSGSFGSGFANCSLEHMDHLSEVLRSVWFCLTPGGPFLLSVVNDNLCRWATLRLLAEAIGEPERAQSVQAEYEAYHHLVNALPTEVWAERLTEAGFEVLEYIPIVPEVTSRVFLFLDNLWHLRLRGGEAGMFFQEWLGHFPNVTQAMRNVLHGLLQMERDWTVTSGVVFFARKRK
ncbi:class I SAM-dependent methyltransferase, partial [Thermoanaerobaculum aquaticum]|uniref:class I SAM-dependent methyltransferase n=1 Tax=Thermoanaerobaculum aquaticum TaxID=1312852 RepID=UPI001268CD16